MRTASSSSPVSPPVDRDQQGTRSTVASLPASVSPTQADTEAHDLLTSAKWFILGLEIELKKALEPEDPHPYQLRDDDQDHEGRYFSRERMLDLVMGVRLSLFLPSCLIDRTFSNLCPRIETS